MKRFIALILLGALLSGCAQKPEPKYDVGPKIKDVDDGIVLPL